MVYGEVGAGWYCYGCSRGGRIYELASLLEGGPWGRRDLCREVFTQVKERVHSELGFETSGEVSSPPAPRVLWHGA